jgi:hypothetical protein
MPRNKIVVKKAGFIDPKSFGTVRRSEIINYEEFKEFFNRSLENSENGILVWKPGTILPQYLLDLTEEMKSLFQLKKEVSTFGVRIWNNMKKDEENNIIKVERVPTQFALSVAARIFITIGSNENLNLFASAAGKQGNGNVTLLENQAFLIPIGHAAGIDVTINNKKNFKSESKLGFRPKMYSKNPSKRYFVVIDCITNKTVLADSINKESKIVDLDVDNIVDKINLE